MKRLNHIKDTLIAEIESQMTDLRCVDTKELGEVVDMVKDIEEAIYYHTITEAMNDKEIEGWGDNSSNTKLHNIGEEREHQMELRDKHEGRSPKLRKMYMESKSMHHDKSAQMQGLEQYMKELSQDITEMISGSSPEEKQLLKTKLTTLVSKIDQA